MRRGTRQRLNGDGRDWVSKRTRYMFRLSSRPGVGKKTKRAMAKQRRPAPIDADASERLP
jgi:hypothetical protein